MPWSIELFFEPAIDAQLRAAWRELAPLAASDYVLKNAVHPHCALAVFDELPAAAPLIAALEQLARETAPLNLAVKGVGRFASIPAVLYLGFLRQPALLECHTRLATLIARHDRTNHTYYRLDRWVPHCTLAQQVPSNRIASLELAARDRTWPRTLRADRLALVAFPPTQVLWSQPLGAAPA